MEEPEERRRHRRRSVAVGAALMWENDSGVAQWAWARCLDLSESGARLELSQAIPAFQRVYLRLTDLGIESYGVVRHASVHGTVGVEFNLPLADVSRIPVDRYPREPSG